jgi:hypothetical protein
VVAGVPDVIGPQSRDRVDDGARSCRAYLSDPCSERLWTIAQR